MRIPLSVHGAVEIFAAPAVMAAPFLLGFGPAPTALAVMIGVLLLGLALQADGPSRTLPLSAHEGFDYMLAMAAIVGGITVGLSTEEWNAGIFLVGVGIAQAMLTAMTRFSHARSA